MAYRNRPVLGRKRRPRWQEELRTQQLVVGGFAVAIAVALGIFGASAWNGYWEGHLRPVASVDGVAFDREDLTARERIITAELTGEAFDIQAQLAGGSDPLLEQRLQELSAELGTVTQDATDSLVEGAVLRAQPGDAALTVSDEEIDAEIAERSRLPERRRLAIIVFGAAPEPSPSPSAPASPSASPSASPDASASPEETAGAAASASPEETASASPSASPDESASASPSGSPAGPSEEDFARAEEEAQATLERLEAGEDFATVAAEVSDDFSGQSAGGEIGLVEADDPAYAEYYEAVEDAEADEVVGPARIERGYALVKLLERVEATADEAFEDLLSAAAVGAAAYRDYIRDELLVEKAREYFEEEVATSPQPQRRVAQIRIAARPGDPVPERRARHILVQPFPDAQDQTTATEEQWGAALAQAEDVRELVSDPDADWFELAAEHSGDRGSAINGGDLGWFDPVNSGFVAEFATAAAELEVGAVSEPVRTQFGYHVIQVTDERESPAAQAEEVAAELREAPDSFADVAMSVSEDTATAREGGEIGWVARFQLAPEPEEAIFALEEGEEISDLVDVEGDGIYIFTLLEISESGEVEEERLEQIRSTGFDRWLSELREPATIWVDPAFASSDLTGG
jgi:parvulin-like peptidyl-prolyl isomerase